MIFRTTTRASLILALALFGMASLAAAQDEPKPAGTSTPLPPINTGDSQDQNGNVNLAPDSTPLTGVQAPTLGSPETQHSYWIPGFQWSGTIQSNSYNQTPNSGWIVNNYFVGTLSLLKAWPGSQLAFNYSGGGFVSSDSTQGNGSYQQFAISQTFLTHRWQVQFLDQFSYLPQTSLGFGGGTSLGTAGSGGGPVIPGMGNNYVPNQSIYSAEGPRYSNAAVVQITYSTSARGSFTVSGSYGLLNFVNAGNVDNQSTTATIGYNYLLTRKDTLGVFYRFSAYHFSGEPTAYGDHSVNIAYGRKLTGRLALQTYAGPSFTLSRPVSTGSGSGGTGTGTTTGGNLSYGVNLGANLTMGFKDATLIAGYSHGVSGGSGVLAGSTADQLNFNANHKLGRIWTGQFNFSYAHNKPIATLAQTVAQTYNTYNFGGGVSRPLGREATIGVAYNATLTDYGSNGCTGTACTSNQTYNYVTINFQWHARPLVLP